MDKRSTSVEWTVNNEQVKQFLNENRQVIYSACRSKGLRRSDWEIVENSMAIKFAQGKIQYNPERGVKRTTYIYAIARNTAIDLFKKQLVVFEEEDDITSVESGDERRQFASLHERDEKNYRDRGYQATGEENEGQEDTGDSGEIRRE